MSAQESKSVELTLLRALGRLSQSKLPEQIERRRIETQAVEFEAWKEQASNVVQVPGTSGTSDSEPLTQNEGQVQEIVNPQP